MEYRITNPARAIQLMISGVSLIDEKHNTYHYESKTGEFIDQNGTKAVDFNRWWYVAEEDYSQTRNDISECIHNLTCALAKGKLTLMATELLNDLCELLEEKNKNYGDSALYPINIFSDEGAQNSILIRIDDKLNRIRAGRKKGKKDTRKKVSKNDLCDLMGYLILLCVSLKYVDFSDIVD